MQRNIQLTKTSINLKLWACAEIFTSNYELFHDEQKQDSQAFFMYFSGPS